MSTVVGSTTKCRRCNASIYFLRTKAGNHLPCNLHPSVPLIRNIIGADGEVYAVTPHWATCPNADEFRRKK